MELTPESDLKTEGVVLGAMLLENCFHEVADMLSEGDFFDPFHKAVYKACVKLYQENSPIDIITVSTQLRKDKYTDQQTAFKVAELTKNVNSSANIEYHARILNQIGIRRQTLEAIQKAPALYNEHSEDALLALDTIAESFYNIKIGTNGQEPQSMVEIIEAASKKLEQGGVVNVFTPWQTLNEKLKLEDSGLFILAARPGMGKTAFALQIAKDACECGQKGLFFSLEMSNIELLARLVSSETGFHSAQIKDYANQSEEVKAAIDKAMVDLAPLRLKSDDQAGANIQDICSKAKKIKAKDGLDFVIVDYLQLCTVRGEKGMNREQEISLISRSLKGLAKDLDVPVIALSQLSRAVEQRGGDKIPQLSDLRESGAIEQDADGVVFLCRPDYYGITEDEDGNAFFEGDTIVKIAKQRNGALGNVILGGNLSKFTFFDKY